MAREEHMSYAEIATALDISLSTVKTQMSRALTFLRKRLKIYDFASQTN
jgi:DNA-directed RNA polymerase specialized sigma24 family protein